MYFQCPGSTCVCMGVDQRASTLTLLAYLGNRVSCVTCGMWSNGKRHIVAWSKYSCSIPHRYAEVFPGIEGGGKKLLIWHFVRVPATAVGAEQMRNGWLYKTPDLHKSTLLTCIKVATSWQHFKKSSSQENLKKTSQWLEAIVIRPIWVTATPGRC